MRKNLYVVVLLVACAASLTSCASSQKRACSSDVKDVVQETRDQYEIQKPITVRTSEDTDSNRPEWTKVSCREGEKVIAFSSAFFGGSDLALSTRAANAEALKNLAQSIGQFIRVEFSSFAEGSNSGGEVDRWMSDGISVFVSSLRLTGIRQTKVYWEELISPELTPMYNAFVILEISKHDYILAKADALKSLRERFKKEKDLPAKEKAERLLEELKRDFYLQGHSRREKDNGNEIEEYALNF